MIYLIDLDQIKSGEKKLKQPQRKGKREREKGLDKRGSESDQGLLCQRVEQRDQI